MGAEYWNQGLSPKAPQPSFGVGPGKAGHFGVEPDAEPGDGSDSPDEAVLIGEAMRAQVSHAMGEPTGPCGCADVEKFLCRDKYAYGRRQCCCAFCGIPPGPGAGPGQVRCRNLVPIDLIEEYDADFCRLCRAGHCRQHFQWLLDARRVLRTTGAVAIVPLPPLVPQEPL